MEVSASITVEVGRTGDDWTPATKDRFYAQEEVSEDVYGRYAFGSTPFAAMAALLRLVTEGGQP